MLDTQGRGNILDDSRIEKVSVRAVENARTTADKLSAADLSQQLKVQVGNQVSQIHTSGATSMNDSYARQIQLLADFNNSLQQLPTNLNDKQEGYKQKINNLSVHGFTEDYTQPLQQKHQRLAEKITTINQCIEAHRHAVENYQDTLRRLQADAQQN